MEPGDMQKMIARAEHHMGLAFERMETEFGAGLDVACCSATVALVGAAVLLQVAEVATCEAEFIEMAKTAWLRARKLSDEIEAEDRQIETEN